MCRFLAVLALFPLAFAHAAELDVTRVVLYKHGVGYFERAGEVAPGDAAVLRFKASEMDDVLKSLTVEQVGGEGVSAVRYDSSDPLAKRLEVFPFRLGEAVSLSQILDQFKGAEVELALGGGALTGTIVSARQMPATQNEAGREQLVLLAGGALRTVDPAAAASLRFTDGRLQAQFEDYLTTLARSRNTDRRTVTVESRGAASRIAAGYIAPTPIWKSSYRLIFDAQQRPLLEGWAIVDNTSGEDWTNVRLSLVSGLPVSFISRLYEPRYLQRQVVELAMDRAWTPKIHGGVVEDMADEDTRRAGLGGFEVAAMAPAAPSAKAMTAGRMRQSPDLAASAAESEFRRNELSSTVAATAVKAELGELFEYRIEHPVTIRKSESAMLPFFRERVAARRLYIYEESSGSQHPLNAVEVTNGSGATLDGGAITVYDGGGYAGEGLVETIKAGDKRLISYAVDLGTRITSAFESSSKLQSRFRVSRGVLTTTTAQRETKTFTIRNVDPREKTVVIEHPVRAGYELVGMTAAEKTASAYRFEVPVGADATRKFAVVEERMYQQSIALTNLNSEQIALWARNVELDEAGRRQLERIADLKRRVEEVQREGQRAEERIQEMSADQERLRQNINTLRSVAGQQERVNQYSETLARQEAELASMRDRQAELRRQQDALQRELNTLFETLTI